MMWKTIWQRFSLPVIAVITGKYQGNKVPRNPFKWLNIWLYGLILIPFTVFIHPFLMLWNWITFLLISKYSNKAEVLEGGIQLLTGRGKILDFYSWEEIRKINLEFKPPIFYPAMKLNNGETVHLYNVERETLILTCQKHRVSVTESLKDFNKKI